MSCGEYDLQGLHAGVYLARETDGRLGEYQCLSAALRSSNPFYVELIMLAQDLLYFPPESGRVRPRTRFQRDMHNGRIHLLSLPMPYD
jgi:hypothetical protein